MLAIVAAVTALASLPPLVRQYRDLTISPDGGKVAAVELAATGEEGREPHATLVVRQASDGAVAQQFDPCPPCEYAAPAWSPDGAKLAFLAINPEALTATLDVVEADQV